MEKKTDFPKRLATDARSIAAYGDERGASMLEYALIAASIAVVLIFSTTMLGRETSRSINGVHSEICLANDKKLNPAAYAPRPPGGAEGEAPGQHCFD